ncbi:MAG: ComF family protein [Pirellulales bacterium]
METKIGNVGVSNRRPSLAAAGGRFVRWCRGAGLDLLFPASCAGCGLELEEVGHSPFCFECIGRLTLIRGATCVRCGAPVPGQIARERCYTCRGTKLWFDETVALGQYDGLLRDWLLKMKHGRGESLTLAIAELIWQQQVERLTATRPDVVVPVPMHWRRRWVRGTNSAAVLAERLAERLQVPLAVDLLRRTRHTPPQFSLPPSERPANVRNAFAVRPGYHFEEARVLLVDDILTTGSTCSAAARALKQAGAAHVAVAVAARTIRH